ncbi:MAG: hypothetical protein WAU39_03315 [Polyangiales bacterium]
MIGTRRVYPKGDWCEVVDGLYWSFVRDHRDFFDANPRSKMMARTLDRLPDDRKKRIFALADAFIERVGEMKRWKRARHIGSKGLGSRGAVES